MSLLAADNLHAFYGKSHVLHGVDLRVEEGEIVGLLGRNGAGRSTVLKAIMGQVSASGSVRLRSEEMIGLPVFQIAHKGVGYVPETRDVFPTLTVEQNLILGIKKKGARWTAKDMYRMFPQLEERCHVRAGLLSGGEQQLLALCRTSMGDPDLILIDEPTEGLAPMIVDQVAAYIGEMQRRGTAILLVEQKLTIALDISQRVYVMGHGAIKYEGTPQQLRAETDIQREWLGV